MANKKLYSWGTKNKGFNSGLIFDATKEEDNAYSSDILMDPNPYEEMDQSKSKKNNDNIIDTTEYSEDNLINTRRHVKKQMPQTLSVFSKKESLIRDAEYTFIDKNNEVQKGTRTKPSPKYMKPILDGLRDLDLMLDSAANLQTAEVIQRKFQEVCLACEKYLRNRNPWSDEGKARKQMVQDFYDQVRVESMRFSNRIEEMEKNASEVTEGKWVDVLCKVRTETYTDGEDGVKISQAAGGTSELLVLEKDNKRLYFKESEKLPPDTFTEVYDIEKASINAQLKEFEESEDHTQEEKDAYKDKLSKRQTALEAAKTALFKKIGNDYEIQEYINIRQHRTPDGLLNSLIKSLQGTRDPELANARSLLIEVKEEYKKIKEELDPLKAYNRKVTPEEVKKIKDLEEKLDKTEYRWLGKTLVGLGNSMRRTDIATLDAKIDKNAELTRRNVACSRMAKLLGLNDGKSNLIVNSRFADIYVNGKLKQGIVMDEAPGSNVEDLEKAEGALRRNVKYSGNAFREVINLQIFDVIMGQVDRNPGNYLCQSSRKEGTNITEIDHITGIDNDMCGGVLKYKDILNEGRKGINRLRTLEVKSVMQIPVIDNDLAIQIEALTPEMIHYNFCDVLDQSEREALIDRIKGVKSLIKGLRKKERKNRGKAGFSSKFVSRDNKAGWQNCVDSYGKRVKEFVKEDQEKAAQLAKNLKDELNQKGLNRTDPLKYEEELNNIEKMCEEVREDTANQVKQATYFHTRYF